MDFSSCSPKYLSPNEREAESHCNQRHISNFETKYERDAYVCASFSMQKTLLIYIAVRSSHVLNEMHELFGVECKSHYYITLEFEVFLHNDSLFQGKKK